MSLSSSTIQAVPADLSLRPAPSSCLRCPYPERCIRRPLWFADPHASGLVPSLCVVGLTLPPMTLWSFLFSALRFASPTLTLMIPVCPLLHDLGVVDSSCPFPTNGPCIPASFIPSSRPFIPSFHPDLSSRPFIPTFHPDLSYRLFFLIRYLNSSSHSIILSFVPIPHPTSLMLLRLPRNTFDLNSDSDDDSTPSSNVPTPSASFSQYISDAFSFDEGCG